MSRVKGHQRGGLLFVVSAPSGAGKTTLCQVITKMLPGLRHSVSYTTRETRSGEVQGRDYIFVGRPEFQKMVEGNEFLEWAEVHGHLYGTSYRSLKEIAAQGDDVILDIDCQGAMQLREKQVGGTYIYILPLSFEVLKARLKERKLDSPDQISLRLQKAREEISRFKEYSYLIVNDDFERARKELEAIVVAERIKVKRMDLSWVEKEFLRPAKPDPS